MRYSFDRCCTTSGTNIDCPGQILQIRDCPGDSGTVPEIPGQLEPMAYWLFRLFSRHISRTQSFQQNRHIGFHALVALKLLVSLISRLVACSARIVVHRQTDTTTVTLAAHARRGLSLPLSHDVTIEHLPRTERSMLCARLEPGSGSRIGNKATIISAKQQISHGRIRRSTREQQSHTEEHERIRRIARGANNKK